MNAMKPLVVLAAALLARATPAAFDGVDSPDSTAWPEEPAAMLIEHDPWAMVIGADLPLVEVYADGTVLRADAGNTRDPGYLVSQLAPREMERLRESIGPTKELLALRDYYDSRPNVTDQPTTQLVLSAGETSKSVSVYGYALGTVDTPAYTVIAGGEKGDEVPREFDRVARLLAALAPRHELPWKPRYIEVMLWPYDHSPDLPMSWPADWPSVGSPLTFARGNSYSVVLPGSELARLRDYVERRGERQAVLWNGGKWSIGYRLVMPGSALAAQIATAAPKGGG
jgi:hypothetical protein